MKIKTLFKQLEKKYLSQRFSYKTFLIFKTPKFSFSKYVNHRNTIDNNDNTPFDFTPDNYVKVHEILVS